MGNLIHEVDQIDTNRPLPYHNSVHSLGKRELKESRLKRREGEGEKTFWTSEIEESRKSDDNDDDDDDDDDDGLVELQILR